MSVQHLGYVELPPHVKPGGFDHAAVHRATGRVYVAHTANDAIDVIDGVNGCYVYSIGDLAGVAGALVSDERRMVFTSNRGENSVGIFSTDQQFITAKVAVGIRPNGLALDPRRNLLLAANVGDPGIPNSFTVSFVDVEKRMMTADIPVPGRTRWTVYDAASDAFYVNIADPPQIVMIDGDRATAVAQSFPVPAAGPHGLDLDAGAPREAWSGRLFCACDGKRLIVLDSRSGQVLADQEIGGVPDVVWFNPALRHLYVAIGDPGIVEVFETDTLQRLETLRTEKGAHTTAFDPETNKLYVFLPEPHRASVYLDRGN